MMSRMKRFFVPALNLNATFLKLTKHYSSFFFLLHLSDHEVGGCIMFVFVAVCRSASVRLHVCMDLCD